jgi:hypothetical protein
VPTVNVTFGLHLLTGDDVADVPEERLSLEEHGEPIQRQRVLDGFLAIDVEGQPRFEVSDELWAAVQNLCFRAVEELSAGDRECWVYTATSADAHVVVLPEATQLRLLSEYARPVTAPREPLLKELFACGLRVLEFLERLGDPHRGFVEPLRPYAERARAALNR